jgi:hypothetical protein
VSPSIADLLLRSVLVRAGQVLVALAQLKLTYYDYSMTSINVIRKKRGRPATGLDPVTAVRLPEELRKALEAWCAAQGGKPSRSEAIRVILSEYLAKRGFLKNE